MSDTRVGAPAAAPPRAGGFVGFLVETLASLRKPKLVLPLLLLTVLLTASNIVILRNPPAPGGPAPVIFVAAALVRVLGLFALAVALLRALNDSPRSLWRPDGAFWLYGATVLAGIGLNVAAAALIGDPARPLPGALIGFAMIVVSAPLAPWFTAIAVERPLALRPGPRMHGWGRWLPQLVLWSLLVVLPLGQLHATIDIWLVRGAGEWFWPLALVDGPLSAVLALLGLAFASAAYRRVARG